MPRLLRDRNRLFIFSFRRFTQCSKKISPSSKEFSPSSKEFSPSSKEFPPSSKEFPRSARSPDLAAKTLPFQFKLYRCRLLIHFFIFKIRSANVSDFAEYNNRNKVIVGNAQRTYFILPNPVSFRPQGDPSDSEQAKQIT